MTLLSNQNLQLLNLEKIQLDKIYNMNCIEGMQLLPHNKIDLIITDPPFAIDFKATKANYNRGLL